LRLVGLSLQPLGDSRSDVQAFSDLLEKLEIREAIVLAIVAVAAL
jgi:hypothetical protein